MPNYNQSYAENLYDDLREQGFSTSEVGYKDNFINAMQDPEKRKKLFGNLQKNGVKNIPSDYDAFESIFTSSPDKYQYDWSTGQFGFEKEKENEEPAPQPLSQQEVMSNIGQTLADTQNTINNIGTQASQIGQTPNRFGNRVQLGVPTQSPLTFDSYQARKREEERRQELLKLEPEPEKLLDAEEGAEQWANEQLANVAQIQAAQEQEQERRSQPLDPNNPYASPTVGQWEDEVGASVASTIKDFGDKTTKETLDAARKAGDKIWEDYAERNANNPWAFSQGNVVFNTQQSNLTRGQLENLAVDEYKDAVAKIIDSKDFQDRITQDAERLGYDRDFYETKVIDALNSYYLNQLQEELIRQNMPQSDIAYVLAGVQRSIIGGVLSRGSGTLEQWERREAGLQLYEQEHNPNAIARAGNMAAGFAVDMPIFGAIGGAASVGVNSAMSALRGARVMRLAAQTGKSVAGVNRAIDAYVNSTLGARIASRVVPRMVQSGTTLGTYEGLSTATNQALAGYFDPMEIAKQAGHGAVFGAILGGFSGVGNELSNRVLGSATATSSKIARVFKAGTAEAAKYGTEAAAFTLGEQAGQLIMGEDLKDWDEAIASGVVTPLVLKLSNPAGIRELRKAYDYAFNPKRYNQENYNGVKFDKDEQRRIRESVAGQNFFDALMKAEKMFARDMTPEERGRIMSDPSYYEQRSQLSEAYTDLMNDPNIDFVTKQKLAVLGGGVLAVRMPVATTLDSVWDVDNARGEAVLRDVEGRAIESQTFTDERKLNKWVEEKTKVIQAENEAAAGNIEFEPTSWNQTYLDMRRRGMSYERINESQKRIQQYVEAQQTYRQARDAAQQLEAALEEDNKLSKPKLSLEERDQIREAIGQNQGVADGAKASMDAMREQLTPDDQAIMQRWAEYTMERKAKIYERMKAIESKVDDITNNDMGQVVYATLKEGKEKVYVVAGKVASSNNGEIDPNNSDDTVVVADRNGNGKRMVAASDIATVDDVVEPIDEIAEAQRVVEDEIDGELERQAAQPRPAAEETPTEAPTREGEPVFNEGDEIKLNIDGEEQTVTVLSVDGEGNVEVYDPAGDETVTLTPEQLSEYMVREESPEENAPTTEESPATEESALDYVRNRGGYDAMIGEEGGADIAYDAMVEETQGDADMALDVAKDMLKDAEKALEKAKKVTPRAGSTVSEKIKARKEVADDIAEKQAAVDFWNEVVDMPNRRENTIEVEEKPKEEPIEEEEQPTEEEQPSKKEEGKNSLVDELGMADLTGSVFSNSYPELNGIYYKNGYAYVSGDRGTILIKSDYPEEYEGKCINPKTGEEIPLSMTDQGVPWIDGNMGNFKIRGSQFKNYDVLDGKKQNSLFGESLKNAKKAEKRGSKNVVIAVQSTDSGDKLYLPVASVEKLKTFLDKVDGAVLRGNSSELVCTTPDDSGFMSVSGLKGVKEDDGRFIIYEDGKRLKSEKSKGTKEKTPTAETNTSSQNGEMIDDWGEKLAGARKFALSEIAEKMKNVTVANLVAQPMSKVFPRQDFIKQWQQGKISKDDALLLEAIQQLVSSKRKPTAKRRGGNYKIQEWAKEVFNYLEAMRIYCGADDDEKRQAMREVMLSNESFVKTESEKYARLKDRYGNDEDVEIGDLYTPSPIKVALDITSAMGYPNQEIGRVTMPTIEANYNGTRYRVILNKSYYEFPTYEEALARAIKQCKIQRGDMDVTYSPDDFRIVGEGYKTKATGKYAVVTVKGRTSNRRTFDTKEEAQKYFDTLTNFKDYEKNLYEDKVFAGYDHYAIKVYDPVKYERNDLEDIPTFATKEEAEAWIDANMAELNDAANATLSNKNSTKEKKEQQVSIDVYYERDDEGKILNTMGLYLKLPWSRSKNIGQLVKVAGGFKTWKEAKAWEEAHRKEIADKLAAREAAMKALQKQQFFNPAKPRRGTDWRKGKDITAEEFGDAFGFRGVQFGNWTDQADRQKALNEAYDAFMDLAELLGISPRAMSLAGELGIAFGSRGTGWANAHYETDNVVINLTKTRGAGSLAHEWWHALDNYLARRGGVSLGFLTDSTGRNADVRDAVRDAFNALTKAIDGSNYDLRSKSRGPYWGQEREETARLFADWVSKRLIAQGKNNSFLSHGVSEELMKKFADFNYETYKDLTGEDISFEEFAEKGDPYKGFPEPIPSETEAFAPYLERIFDTIEERVDGDKTILFRDTDRRGRSETAEDVISSLENRFHYPVKRAENLDEVTNAEARRRIERDIERGTHRTKGWYDPETGEVVIYMPNCTNAKDATRTILHEVKGHRGLRSLLGERFNETMGDIYRLLPEDVRKTIADDAQKYYENDINIATEEFLAETAEADAPKPNWWRRALARIKATLRQLGFDVKLSDADINYLLWKAEEKLRENGKSVFDRAEDISRKEQTERESIAEVRQRAVDVLSKIRTQKIPDILYRSNDIDDLEETNGEENIPLFRIGRRRREEMERRLNKRRPDLSNEEKGALFDYLDTLNDTKVENATFDWFTKGTIRIPEDMDKVRQALEVAEKAKVNPAKYNSPMELINDNADFKPTKPRINPDEVEELQLVAEYPHGVKVYTFYDPSDERLNDYDELEDDEKERLQNVRNVLREIIDSHWGVDANPWCLLAKDEDGKLRDNSLYYWNNYSRYGKMIAFQDGKLLAFFAESGDGAPTWWDRNDHPHSGIPITMPLQGDNTGKMASYDYKIPIDDFEDSDDMWIPSEDTDDYTIWKDRNEWRDDYKEGYGKPRNIYRGNKKNGVYEEFDDNSGELTLRTEYKKGKEDGVHEEFNPRFNTKIIEEPYKDGKLNGTRKRWIANGALAEEGEYKDGRPVGVHKSYYAEEYGGGISERKTYENGMVRKRERFFPDGTKESVNTYNERGENIKGESWYRDGSINTIQIGIPANDTYYYEEHNEGDGSLLELWEVKNGNGFCRKWNGNILYYEVYFKDGNKDGVEIERSLYDGKLERIRTYKDGRENGEERRYYDGNLEYIENWKDGKKDGDYLMFHPEEGIVDTAVRYKDGRMTGVELEFKKDGTLTKRIDFDKGENSHISVYWYGRKYPEHVVYRRGDNMTEIYLNDDGRIVSVDRFLHDEKHGLEERLNWEKNTYSIVGWLNGERRGETYSSEPIEEDSPYRQRAEGLNIDNVDRKITKEDSKTLSVQEILDKYDPLRGKGDDIVEILFGKQDRKNEPTVFREERDDAEENNALSKAESLNDKVATTLNALAHAKDDNADRASLRAKAVQAIGENLLSIKQAMSQQRQFDRESVGALSKLANQMLEAGLISEPNQREMKQLLSTIPQGVRSMTKQGQAAFGKAVDRLYDIMNSNQWRNSQNAFNKALNTKGFDTKNGPKRAVLDDRGNALLNELKTSLNERHNGLAAGIDRDVITERSWQYGNDVAENDEDMKATGRYEAMSLLGDYYDNVLHRFTEEADMRREIEETEAARRAGEIDADTARETIASLEDAIRESSLERAAALGEITQRLRNNLAESRGAINEWQSMQNKRKSDIIRDANADGKRGDYPISTAVQNRPTGMQRVVNSELVQFFTSALPTFDMLFRMYGHNNVNGEGRLWKRFTRQYTEASDKQYKEWRAATDELNAKVAEVYGRKGLKWSDMFTTSRKDGNVSVYIYDGNAKDAEGKPLKQEKKLSQGNLAYIYMVNKMTDGKMKLRRMGISEEDVEKIVASLDPRLVELADWLQTDFFPELMERYNVTHRQVYGVSMEDIPNYAPLKIQKRAIPHEEDMTAISPNDKLPSTMTGSIIQRTRNTLPIDILNADMFGVVADHVRDMSHWMAFAQFNKDLCTLLSYKKFRNQTFNMTTIMGGGDRLWERVKTACIIASGNYTPTGSRGGVDAIVTNVAKGATSAQIALRFYTAFKQLASGTAGIHNSNWGELTKAFANPVGSWRWAMRELPGFSKRWMSRIAGETRLMPTESDWGFWRTNTIQRLQRAGMAANASVDCLTVACMARATYNTKYKQYINEGYSQEDADRMAKSDAAVSYNETQQSTENLYVTRLQLDNTVTSVALSVFNNAPFGYGRQTLLALSNLSKMLTPGYRAQSLAYMARQHEKQGLDEEEAQRAAEKEYRKAWGRNIIAAANFAVLLPALWQLFSFLPQYLVRKWLGGDDEDKNTINDITTYGLCHSVDGLVLGKYLGDLAYGVVREGSIPYYYDNSMLPMLENLENVIGEIGTDRWVALNDAVNLIAMCSAGYNIETLQSMVEGIYNNCGQDEFTTRNAALMVMAVLNVPKSQRDNVYFDELGLSAKDAEKLTPKEIAERYALQKAKHDAGWTWFLHSEEAKDNAYERALNSANRKARERAGRYMYEDVRKQFEEYDNEYKELKRKKDLTREERRKVAIGNAFDNAFNKVAKVWLTTDDPARVEATQARLVMLRNRFVQKWQDPDATFEDTKKELDEINAWLKGINEKK